MTAPTPSYPGSTHVFPVFTDLVDLIYADGYNKMAAEVTSVERVLGYQPHISAYPAYSPTPSTSSVAQRLGLLETDVVTRASNLEQRTRDASARLYLSSATTIGSATTWQNVLLPQVDATVGVNETSPGTGGIPLTLSNIPTSTPFSHFYPNSPNLGPWSMSASITWSAITSGAPAGLRGLRIIDSNGRVLAQHRRPAIVGDTDADVFSVTWCGVAPVAGAPSSTSLYYMYLQVLNSSGVALALSADGPATPTRADFVRHAA
jgi:hypothetical protein